MKKIILLMFFLLIPSFVSATTVTASVGGTLKVYEGITVITVIPLIFPAQYEQTLSSSLINVEGQAPATGIPNIIGETRGRAGIVGIQGTGGTAFTASIASSMTLTGPSSISASLSLWNDSAFTQTPLSSIPGTGLGATYEFFVKGVIASGVQLLAGNYAGSALFSLSYN